MVATLAWTRLDLAMPDWTFFGGARLVWTATRRERKVKSRLVYVSA